MYKKPRLIQVHKANTELVPANGGILAGCGFAVHYISHYNSGCEGGRKRAQRFRGRRGPI
eukprot:6733200-Heterocapsa_arctica.AAC.1